MAQHRHLVMTIYMTLIKFYETAQEFINSMPRRIQTLMQEITALQNIEELEFIHL